MDDDRYRSVFHSPMCSADAFRAARDEMRAWLRGKAYDMDAFDAGSPRIGRGAILLHSSANAAEGSQTERWHLREEVHEGAWNSSFTVHAPADPAENAITWFWIEIEFTPDSRDVQRRTARAPRLTRGILSVVQAFDSLATLADEPSVVTLDRVDELIDVLCDPGRRLPTVVASPHPAVGFEDWKHRISHVTDQLPGLASVYLLDPLAAPAFTAAIGTSHAVTGGALRTFMPNVDPAVADEALRHKVMSAERLKDEPERAGSTLSLMPRRHASEVPLPAELGGVRRSLLTQSGGTPMSHEELAAKLADERDVAFGLAEEQEARANALFAQRQQVLAELAEREQQVLRLDYQVRALRHHLVLAGRDDVAFQRIENPAPPPSTFSELVEWMDDDLCCISFTGELSGPISLDQSPEASTWVRSTWEALRAMQSYAEAKKSRCFPGDFKTWCESQPSGAYHIPAGKVARDESESVRQNAKWRRQREFPVPAEIDPAGRAFMGGHVRIGASAGGRLNPRMYYLDATARTGIIYIGYLGRHLSNTRT